MTTQRLTAEEFLEKIKSSGSWIVHFNRPESELELYVMTNRPLRMTDTENSEGIEKFLGPELVQMATDALYDFLGELNDLTGWTSE